MRTIPPVYPAHIVVSQAQVRFVADRTANATPITIKVDQQRIEAAQAVEIAEAEAAEAKNSSVDIIA